MRFSPQLALIVGSFFLCAGAASGGVNVVVRGGDPSTISPDGPLSINDIDEAFAAPPWKFRLSSYTSARMRLGRGPVRRSDGMMRGRFRGDGTFGLRNPMMRIKGRWSGDLRRMRLEVSEVRVRDRASTTLMAINTLMPPAKIRREDRPQVLHIELAEGYWRLVGTVRAKFETGGNPVSLPSVAIRFRAP